MCAVVCLSSALPPTLRLQRAVGDLKVAVKRLGAETVLDDLRQAGCLKARFPRRLVPGWIDIVTLNTGGGVAGGDRLDLSFALDRDTQATVSAQAAERFYRALSRDQPSRVRTTLSLAAGSFLEWLPQETILFDRSALDRRLEIEMAADARLLAVETLVFGRAAMQETVQQGWLRDLIRVRRAGELLLHDAIRMDGDLAAILRLPAVAQGASTLATLVYVAPEAETMLDPVRQAMAVATADVEAGASAWNGMLIVRILGRNSAVVRRAVVGTLAAVRASRPLPRVWLC